MYILYEIAWGVNTLESKMLSYRPTNSNHRLYYSEQKTAMLRNILVWILRDTCVITYSIVHLSLSYRKNEHFMKWLGTSWNVHLKSDLDGRTPLRGSYFCLQGFKEPFLNARDDGSLVLRFELNLFKSTFGVSWK